MSPHAPNTPNTPNPPLAAPRHPSLPSMQDAPPAPSLPYSFQFAAGRWYRFDHGTGEAWLLHTTPDATGTTLHYWEPVFEVDEEPVQCATCAAPEQMRHP